MNKSNLSWRLLATTLLSGIVASSGFSWAQEAESQSDDSSDAEVTTIDPAAEEDVAVMDVITITGSRIQRNEFTAAAPVQVITSERSSLQGLVDAADVLQGASVAAGSGQINNTFTGFVVDGGPGIDSISLRGLGGQRTLVLLNGRRFPPAGVGGTVGPIDLNVIPEAMVQRYEILKDGASSIYGSDAVAGVINVITRDAFDGWNFASSLNITAEGGADETSLSAAYGKTVDRGSFIVSAEYYKQEALTLGERENFRCPQDLIFNDDGSRADLIDPTTGDFKCYNQLEGYVQTFYSPNAPFGLGGGFYGSRVPDPAGVNYEGVPGYRFIPYQERSFNDPREESTTIISPRERFTVFANGTYRPAAFDTTELYGEFIYHRRESEQNGYRQLFPWYHPDSALNPYGVDNPAFDFGPLFGLDPGLFVAPIDGFTARPIVLIPFDNSQEVDVFRAMGGARGDFSGSFLSGWNWDAFVSYSESSGEYTRDVVPSDRVDAGTGTIQDSISLNPDGICGPSAPAGCVPLDLFNTATLFDGAFSPEAAAYYLLKETGQTDYSQLIAEASIAGELFELPAGGVGAAFGVHFREDEIDDVPGEFGRASNAWGLLSAVDTVGSDSVYEAFAEIEVPILRNVPAFEDLTLNVSGRYSNYDSVGDATTYKAGLNWQIVPAVRLRATYGTSFRAPQLYELFLGDQTSFLSQISIDPCINYGVETEGTRTDPVVAANCEADGLPPNWGGGTSSAEILTGGGTDLEPEDSNTFTAGFIITPPETGLSLAVDYFDIEVENQIDRAAAGVVFQCYRDEGFRDASGFCDLFTRVLDPTASNFGTITDIDASYRNLPSQQTSGVDITLAYQKEFSFGEIVVDGQATWTETDKFQEFPGGEVFDFNGTIGDPEWVGQLQSRFNRGDWTTTWTVNYTGESDQFGYRGEDGVVGFFYADGASNITDVDEFITHNLSIRKQWDNLTALIGVRNIFDEGPPVLSDGDDQGSASRLGNYPFSSQYYDGFVGTSVFVTVELNL